MSSMPVYDDYYGRERGGEGMPGPPPPGGSRYASYEGGRGGYPSYGDGRPHSSYDPYGPPPQLQPQGGSYRYASGPPDMDDGRPSSSRARGLVGHPQSSYRSYGDDSRYDSPAPAPLPLQPLTFGSQSSSSFAPPPPPAQSSSSEYGHAPLPPSLPSLRPPPSSNGFAVVPGFSQSARFRVPSLTTLPSPATNRSSYMDGPPGNSTYPGYPTSSSNISSPSLSNGGVAPPLYPSSSSQHYRSPSIYGGGGAQLPSTTRMQRSESVSSQSYLPADQIEPTSSSSSGSRYPSYAAGGGGGSGGYPPSLSVQGPPPLPVSSSYPTYQDHRPSEAGLLHRSPPSNSYLPPAPQQSHGYPSSSIHQHYEHHPQEGSPPESYGGEFAPLPQPISFAEPGRRNTGEKQGEEVEGGEGGEDVRMEE